MHKTLSALFFACGTLAFAASASAKDDDLGRDWKQFCEIFPQRCEAIKQKCDSDPKACQEFKDQAAERRALWEKQCAEHPKRCEALKKRRAEISENCRKDPEACRARAKEKAARFKKALAACEDFKDKDERTQCMAHRLKHDDDGKAGKSASKSGKAE